MRDWLFVEDHVRAIDVIFHNGKFDSKPCLDRGKRSL